MNVPVGETTSGRQARRGTMSIPRWLTWVTTSDGYDPGYVERAGAKLTELYGTAGQRHGFEFRFVDAAELIPACAPRPRLWYEGADLLTERQCVMISMSSWDGQTASFLRAIYATVEASDSVLLNRAIRGPESLEHDKLAMVHHAAGLGIATPPTVAIPFGRYARRALPAVREAIPDGPYLLKPRDMGMGFGVLKLDTLEQVTAAVDVCAGADQGFLIQRFLPNSGDLRAYMVNGEMVAAQLRRPAPGHYLANISQGGSGSAATATAVGDLCQRIASSLQASYLCIDWLLTDDGPVLNEWGTAVASFSGLPEPERGRVADAFFLWASQELAHPAPDDRALRSVLPVAVAGKHSSQVIRAGIM